MRCCRHSRLLAAVPVFVLTAAPVLAQEEAPDPRIQADTGRLNANWPHDRHFDHLHMRLELDFPDMTRAELTGVETLRVAAVGKERGTLPLDCRGPTVDAVTVRGQPAGFTAADGRLLIVLNPPARPGEEVEAVIRYHREFSADRGNGLTYSKGNPQAESVTSQFAQIHSQGEAEFNSRWFPCHDFPNEKFTSEMIVTVESGFEVVSNGRLVSSEPAGEGRTRWHWVQDKPHPAYLVALAVAKFAVVDIGGPESGRPGLSMPVYTPVGTEENVRAIFGNTPRMIACFEKLFRQPYPWDKYAQVMVRDFAAGGMENTSCTFLTVGTSRPGRPGSRDDLISHELGHQWFGDLVTCNSWDHVWLNEGMATFMNTLWIEQRDGKDAYHAQVRGSFDGIIAADKPEAPAAVGMVSRAYRSPWDAFQRPANPYGKGASILHMLRVRLGDDLFFKGLARYIDDRKFQTAETLDLRRAFEAVSGDTLEQFFTQWCTRPGTPSLDVKTAWDEGTKTWTLRVAQTQRIDGDNPAYEFDLPVYLETGTPGQGRRVVVAVKGRSAELAVPLDAAPSLVAIDPDLSVLGAIRTDLDEGANMAGLERGPTLPARMQAARGLAKPGAARVSDAIRRMVMDAKHPTALRVEMVKTLLGRGDMADLRSLFTAVTDSWEVREELTRAVADLTQQDAFKGDSEMRENIAEQLAARAGKDASLKVRAAALRGLGKLGAVQHAGVIGKALDTPSQSDILRQAALDALGSLDTRQGLDAAILLTRPGHDGRTREAAAAMVGRLGHHDKDKALGVLRDLLRDRELRTRRGAGAGLVALKDERALAEFEKAIKDSRAGEWTIMLTRWSEDLREALASKP